MAAMGSIARTFQKHLATGLQAGRGFRIPDVKDQATDTTDCKPTTWRSVKAP